MNGIHLRTVRIINIWLDSVEGLSAEDMKWAWIGLKNTINDNVGINIW